MSILAGATAAIGTYQAAKSLFANRKKTEAEQDARQIAQQKKLNELGISSAKELADYEQKLKMKMWQDTNYGAILDQAKKAGVSKAHAIGGGGASTAQGASVGGTGEATAATGVEGQNAKLNNDLLKAQIGNIAAQTDKLRSETKGTNFDNKVNQGIGTDAFIRKTNSQLAKERVQNKYEYRKADNLIQILNDGGSNLDQIVDEFGNYDANGRWKQLAESDARQLLAGWDSFKANVDNINQSTNESKSKESLNKIEKEILDFKSELTDLGLNETTVKIIEMMMKLMLSGRR